MTDFNEHEFSPKVCGQIHKRVDEKITRIESDISRIRDVDIPNLEKRVLEKLHDCELRMLDKVQSADYVASNTIKSISSSLKEGLQSVTNGINALRAEIENLDDKYEKLIPEHHKEEHEQNQNLRNRIYWSVAIITIILMALSPQIVMLLKAVIEHLATFAHHTQGGH